MDKQRGGVIVSGLNASLKRLLKVDKTEYEDTWMEGETITTMKGRIGQQLYDEGIATGDIIEKENRCGKLLAYTYKEKAQGERKMLSRSKEIEKAGKIELKDSL